MYYIKTAPGFPDAVCNSLTGKAYSSDAAAPISSNNSAISNSACGFGFGGQFLDRLARSLQFGLFRRTGDVQGDLHRDFRVQRHRDGVQAQVLDRRSSTT
jgi:hypothetical protein